VKRNWLKLLLPLASALLGLLGLILRGGLYAYAVDEKGLLLSGHPLEAALWAVVALMAVLAVMDARKPEEEPSGGVEMFHPSVLAAMGNILLACGILLTVLPNGFLLSPVEKLWRIAGLASGPLLLYAAFCRALGKTPFFLSYLIPCLFFVLHLVAHYQGWCADPELQNYVFPFLSTIGLMFLAFYHSAAAVGRDNRRMNRFAAALTVFLCLVSLANTVYPALYLGGAFWALTGFGRKSRLPQNQKAGEDHELS